MLALDLPGHCAKRRRAADERRGAADWLLALLDAAGVDEAALVGHSFGSLIALEAAARAPERVTHLVLVGTAYPMEVSAALLDGRRARSARGDRHGQRLLALDAGAPPSYPGPGTWLYGAHRALMRRVQMAQREANLFLHRFPGLRRYRNGLEAAARVACPATLVLGARDQMTPPKQAGALAAALRARVVTLDSGHSLMSEAPDALLAAVRRSGSRRQWRRRPAPASRAPARRRG